MCVDECSACMYVWAPCMWNAHRGQKRVSDAPELESQTAVNRSVDAGNQIEVLFEELSALKGGVLQASVAVNPDCQCGWGGDI